MTRIALSPRGRPFTQSIAQSLANEPGALFLSGRFEGIDQRVLDHYQFTEISIGDYVLTGGEIATQVLIDATVRLIPRVLGNAESALMVSWNTHNIPGPALGWSMKSRMFFSPGTMQRSLSGVTIRR